MIEVLSPAGSSDALVAAVQNGADAVYLGYGAHNARMSAKNFTEDQLRQSVSYCHIRGVKVYLTLNTLALDKELKEVSQVVLAAKRAGVDAILVQDLGVCQLIRQVAPDMAIHASTQMAVHNLSGVQQAAQMGISRVVLARELSRAQIWAICRESPIELEVFVHGALCMCHSGQCYMSAMIGGRSGNRGRCAQPCRMPYGFDRSENRYPLSLKDNCLVRHIQELERMGVACVKIEGRMKRAEYVAITTRIYKNAALGRPVTQAQLDELRKVFSRQGFTEGYFAGQKGEEMFGIRQEEETDRNLFARARATYENAELQRVPIRMFARVAFGQQAVLTVRDDMDREVTVAGPMAAVARTRPLTEQELLARLSKTGGTPYYVTGGQAFVEPGLILSAADINAMRREALSRLSALRGQPPAGREGTYSSPTVYGSHRGKPVFTVSIQSVDQLTQALHAFGPALVYVPLHILASGHPNAETICRLLPVCAVLPRVILENEWHEVLRQLSIIRQLGVEEALVGNLGMIDRVRAARFRVRGDFGLNVFNSGTANVLSELGLTSMTASFELTLPQIRDLSKPVPMEMIAYGRLPLMITENCVIHSRTNTCTCGSGKTGLVDRTGSRFPVVRDGGTCRSVILNSRKLYWGDKLSSLSGLGLWALRLSFTTENAQEMTAVLEDYRTGAAFDPGAYTRGLYTRGVE